MGRNVAGALFVAAGTVVGVACVSHTHHTGEALGGQGGTDLTTATGEGGSLTGTVIGTSVIPVTTASTVGSSSSGTTSHPASTTTTTTPPPPVCKALSGTCTGKTSDNTNSALTQQLDGTTCDLYFVQNNAWGASNGTQTISYVGPTFKVTAESLSGGNNVLSYPSAFVGSNNGRTTTNPNLPVAVGSIKSVNTTYAWSNAGVSGEYNTSYDVWFDAPGNSNGKSPTGAFLMVWLHKPSNQNPLGGSPRWNGVTVPGVNGTWNVYQGANNGVQCTSYVATSDVMSITFDLNNFIKDAVSSRSGSNITNSSLLTNVFGGFEIWSGGLNLALTQFSVVVSK